MSKPIIGMLHLPPLPGSPRYAGDFDAVRRHLLADAAALVDGGIRQVMLENFGDAPFYPRSVPQYVVAMMTALAAEVRREFDVSLGINVLRNDGCTALSIAHAVGADFIRVNVLCGARLTDQGVIQAIAHDLLRLRRTLGAEQIRIYADIDVKHSAPLSVRPLEEEVADTVARGGADALIVSGGATGRPASVDQLRRIKVAAGEVPVYVGSGVSADNVAQYLAAADGLIVGTWLKRDAVPQNPVDPRRVQELLAACDSDRS